MSDDFNGDFFALYWKTLKEHKGKVMLLAVAVLAAYMSLLWLPKDNPIEQAVEEVIEEETGYKVDLTP